MGEQGREIVERGSMPGRAGERVHVACNSPLHAVSTRRRRRRHDPVRRFDHLLCRKYHWRPHGLSSSSSSSSSLLTSKQTIINNK